MIANVLLKPDSFYEYLSKDYAVDADTSTTPVECVPTATHLQRPLHMKQRCFISNIQLIGISTCTVHLLTNGIECFTTDSDMCMNTVIKKTERTPYALMRAEAEGEAVPSQIPEDEWYYNLNRYAVVTLRLDVPTTKTFMVCMAGYFLEDGEWFKTTKIFTSYANTHALQLSGVVIRQLCIQSETPQPILVRIDDAVYNVHTRDTIIRFFFSGFEKLYVNMCSHCNQPLPLRNVLATSRVDHFEVIAEAAFQASVCVV